MHDTENGTTVLYSCILFMAFEIFFYFDKYTIMIHSVYWGNLYGLYFFHFFFIFRKRRSRKLDSFDARGIFDEYGSEEWGEYLIREAHLSQRFAFDENGYYHCCASIPFPENMQLD